MIEISALFRTDDVVIGNATCRARSSEMSPEELEMHYSVVFPTSGLYVRHVAGERVVATPAVALFFNAHEVQTTSHPTSSGDNSLFVSFSRLFIDEFLDIDTETFPSRVRSSSATIDLKMRQLAVDSRRGLLSPLEAEELTLAVVEALLWTATPGVRGTPGQRSLVADAEEYLGVHFAMDTSLRSLAREVGSSPHHLSRLFRSVTGTTLSAYRTQLRLRAALNAVAGGSSDLSRVAVSAGFYDHSHLTRTMRKHLGTTPSQLRSALGGL